MRIRDMNWMQVEARLAVDDRAVLPLGSTEQHAHLSLATDSVLSERVAVEAAEPPGVPVFPALAYGITPGFMAYPGTVTVAPERYSAFLLDLLDSIATHGFRRILLVNGHGGNRPARATAEDWAARRGDLRVQWHDWWSAPATLARVREIDPVASHASWMENFPWTRIPGIVLPPGAKPALDRDRFALENPAGRRRMLGDGNFHGLYQRPDAEMLALWEVAVAETRAVIADDWRAENT